MINITEFLVKKNYNSNLPEEGDYLSNKYIINTIKEYDDDTFVILLDIVNNKKLKIEYQYLKDEDRDRYLLNYYDNNGDINDQENISYKLDKYLSNKEIKIL